MVQHCIYCKQQGGIEARKQGRTFHRFPLKDPILLEIWKKNLNLGSSFVPNKNSKICSEHFKPECFSGTKERKYLVAGSIPTFFGVPKGACFYCKTTRDSKTGVSLRRFPLDRPDLLKKWLLSINIQHFVPQRDTLICDDHFEKTCFQKIRNTNYFNLRVNAVPSIFLGDKGTQTQDQNKTDNTDVAFCNGDETEIIINKNKNQSEEIQQETVISNLFNCNEYGPLTQDHSNTNCVNVDFYIADETDVHEVIITTNTNQSGEIQPETGISNFFNYNENGIPTQNDVDICYVDETVMNMPTSSTKRRPSSDAATLFESVTPKTKVEIAKPRKILEHDHRYIMTPRSSLRKLLYTRKMLKQEQRKNKLRKQCIKRLTFKVESLKDIAGELRKRNLVSESGLNCLDSIAGSDIGELFKRFLKNRENVADEVCTLSKKHFKSRSPNTGLGISREKYPATLRSFAMTLHFYSPKAYQFVRQKFCRALPDPSTLRSWYTSIDGEPGFTAESFEALKMKVEEANTSSSKVICSLMLDEISIKSGLQNISVGKIRGYVDFGTEAEISDEMPLAKDALVLMVVSLDRSWKLPIGYFLINGIDSNTNAELVMSSLRKLHEVGVKVVSLTLDGPSQHFATMRALGANLEMHDCRPYFPHPSTQSKVFVIFDPCHMLKLIRNCLGEHKKLKDGDGNEIEWRYIEELVKIQENEGLRAGNRLKWAHLKYHKLKMKVYLAAQTFSSSVADSIEFCDRILKLDQFKGSDATVRFIRSVDRIFDFLNSRNPFGKGFKAPLRCNNEMFWRPQIMSEVEYLKKVTNAENVIMTKTRRHVPFVGLITAVFSILNIFDHYVKPDDSQLKYLLTYKFSQDHLELFFCAIRSCGGWCPNPTAAQFVSAYKRLLIHHEVKAANGNVTAMDSTSILSVPSSRPVKIDLYDPTIYDKVINARVLKKYGLDNDERGSVENETPLKLPDTFSSFSRSCVGNISGWVVKKLVDKKKPVVRCEQCQEALFQRSQKCAEFEDNGLVEAKTRGGLIFASESVVKICLHTEKLLRQSLNKINVMTDLLQPPCSLFATLNEHLFDDAVEEPNHIYVLVKNVVTTFIKLRMFSATKIASETAVGEKVRSHLNRQIIWKHQ